MIRTSSLLALVCLLGIVSAASAPAATRPSAAALESELVCPVCETTLDQSDSPVAQKMKVFIRDRIAAGDSAEQIKAKLVDQFGPDVIASPPKSGFGLLAWLVPLLAAGAAAVVIAVLVRAWSRRRAPPAPELRLDPDLERRVDDELARFEG